MFYVLKMEFVRAGGDSVKWPVAVASHVKRTYVDSYAAGQESKDASWKVASYWII